MFDKMIVSDADGAGSRGRSRYFLVSGLVVAVLFFSAVVLSIYAVDLSLGTDQFELSTMTAPVDNVEPEPPQPEQPNRTQSQQSELPNRVHNILRPEESPLVPDSVAVTKSPYQSRPLTPFQEGPVDSAGIGAPGDTGVRSGNPVGTGSAITVSEPTAVAAAVPPPPPVNTKPRNPPAVSKGVVNGRATSLPQPVYPATAKSMGIQGIVLIQVTIDESGKVISAKAVEGHPLLKPAAEKAAWDAKFSTTYLSEVPVKVTGVITYNFKR